jgi:hypothetical protein
MATRVKTANGRLLRVKIGNGATPETFSETCLINTSRGIEFSGSPIENLIPYCDNSEDLPGWMEREMDGLSATITGAGILDTPSLEAFWDWFKSGASKNIQVWIDVATADGGGYYSGAALLTRYGVTGESQRARSTFDATIASDGPWTWTDAP